MLKDEDLLKEFCSKEKVSTGLGYAVCEVSRIVLMQINFFSNSECCVLVLFNKNLFSKLKN